MPGHEFQWVLAWHRSMVQEKPIENEAFRTSLKEVLPEFETIRFEKFGPQAQDFDCGFQAERLGPFLLIRFS